MDANVVCALCGEDLSTQSIPQRQAHYEIHFEPEPSPPESSSHSKFRKWNPKLMLKVKETDDFWWSSSGIPLPTNYTPGLVQLLRNYLTKSHAKGSTQRAVLCYERTVHTCKQRWDVGWGCGYRNFLMACTALMDQSVQPGYRSLLGNVLSPNIRNLQVWIEGAWSAGFDPEGAAELGKLVGTNKWIGTTDLWVAATYLGIPAQLVDFELRNKPEDMKRMVDWIINYFTGPFPAASNSVHGALQGAAPVLITGRMPLILQRKGHSYTIVGYEIDKGGSVNLLKFDPSTTLSEKVRVAALALSQSWPTSQSSRSTSAGKLPKQEMLSPSNYTKSPNPKRRPKTSEENKVIVIDSSDDERPRIEGLQPSTRELNSRSQERRQQAPLTDGVITIDSTEEDEVVIVDERPTFGLSRHNVDRAKRDQSRYKEKSRPKLENGEVLGPFRLKPKVLSKYSKYQILFFPLDDPLTTVQQMQRRTVTSTKII